MIKWITTTRPALSDALSSFFCAALVLLALCVAMTGSVFVVFQLLYVLGSPCILEGYPCY